MNLTMETMEKQIYLKNNLSLIGMPGCGKTTLGKAAAKLLATEFADVDEYIENKEGMSIPEIFKKGEEYFRDLETEAIEEIIKAENTIISTGGGIIKRPRNVEIMKSNSAVVFINRPVDDIASDVNMSTRPLLAGGTARLYELYKERYYLYEKYCDFEILNNGSINDAVNKIVDIWNNII